MKIRDGNYIVIQSFMVTDLQLKGNELLVYAIIFGFSQAESETFSGSLQYLADWTNSTKQGVIKNLKSLLDKGLIGKIETQKNGVKFVEYYATQFNGVLNSVEWGVKQSLTNNIEDNKENKQVKSHTVFTPPTLEEVKAYIASRNSPVDPERFFDYFSAGDWKDAKGNPVKNWKQKVITWETHQPQAKNGRNAPTGGKVNFTKEEIKGFLEDW